jgi:serine protease Do
VCQPWLPRVWFGLAALAIMAPTAMARAGLAERKTPEVEAIRRVQPSVVSISSEKRAASNSRWPFNHEENQKPRISGMGTGVIIDDRGFILTNQHVVDKVQGIEVQLSDGATYPARLLQQDEAMDLAIIKVDAGKSLDAIAIGSSKDLMVGERVITVGNAFGYENTVSLGIISALHRNVTLSDDQVYRNLIQTDACINPGNSGGPLVNIDGELIGINVAVRAGAQGIGFALPIDDVKKVAVELMSTRRLASTWHGLVGSEQAQGAVRAVVLAEVQPGSPAETAGFLPGDCLIKIGARPVVNSLDIERALIDVRPGQKAEVLVRRQGQEKALALEPRPLPKSAPDANDRIWKMLGVRITAVNRDYVKVVSPNFSGTLRGGLFVQSVTPGSPAARALIQRGDILIGMNAGDRDWETIRPDNVLYILRRPEVLQAQSLKYYVVRQNELIQGLLHFAEAPAASARR